MYQGRDGASEFGGFLIPEIQLSSMMVGLVRVPTGEKAHSTGETEVSVIKGPLAKVWSGF